MRPADPPRMHRNRPVSSGSRVLSSQIQSQALSFYELFCDAAAPNDPQRTSCSWDVEVVHATRFSCQLEGKLKADQFGQDMVKRHVDLHIKTHITIVAYQEQRRL